MAADHCGLDLRQGVGHVGKCEVDIAGNHGGSRWRATLERNMRRRGTGAGQEQLDRVMGQAADAGIAPPETDKQFFAAGRMGGISVAWQSRDPIRKCPCR
jgi:hypothetical protein